MFGKSKKQEKIPCYVLVFDQIDIIRKSLDFLVRFNDKLDIIVIENPSPNTPKIRNIIEALGHNKLLKQYYLFEKNITNNAYDIVLSKDISKIRKHNYVMFTDGDLTCDNDNWLTEETNILKHNNNVFACGISLDKSNLPLKSFPDAKNWIPKDIDEKDDYFEAFTGGHLLLFRGKEFASFLEWKKLNKQVFIDSVMHKYCHENLSKKWARTKHAEAYHHTWDLYQYKDNPYTKLKIKKGFENTWKHNDTANYVLKNY